MIFIFFLTSRLNLSGSHGVSLVRLRSHSSLSVYLFLIPLILSLFPFFPLLISLSFLSFFLLFVVDDVDQLSFFDLSLLSLLFSDPPPPPFAFFCIVHLPFSKISRAPPLA